MTATGHRDEASFGVGSMHDPLRRVMMRRPGAILSADHRRWHYTKPIDARSLVAQFDRFVELLGDHHCAIDWLDEGPSLDVAAADDLADSVFTYDPSFVVGGGAVLLRPGKELRAGEVALHRGFYERSGIPVLGSVEAPGTVEGGDLFFLDDTTLAAGRGFRTNQAGLDQLTELLAPEGIDVFVVDLPYHHGPEACLHLLSLISPLDVDLALLHEPLVPTALHQELAARGVELLAAPVEEFEQSGGLSLNVLATGQRRLIAVDGFPDTVELMRSAGCQVDTFVADELCLVCEGGPTCLTRPLHRDAAHT